MQLLESQQQVLLMLRQVLPLQLLSRVVNEVLVSQDRSEALLYPLPSLERLHHLYVGGMDSDDGHGRDDDVDHLRVGGEVNDGYDVVCLLEHHCHYRGSLLLVQRQLVLVPEFRLRQVAQRQSLQLSLLVLAGLSRALA